MEPVRDFYLRLDLRSLGLFRILLASLLVADACLRWPHLDAFYTSYGFLPIEAPLPRAGGPFHFSLLDGLVTPFAVRAFFVAGIAAHLALLVGWKARAATLASLVFFASVLNRNPMIRHAGDVFLVTMLFWAVFLPLGERFSLDALHLADPARETRTRPTLAALAIVAQVAIVYFVAALTKSGEPWWDGTALALAFELDQMATGFARWIAAGPSWLLHGLTWSVLAVEWAAAPAILAPIGQPALRRAAIPVLSAMHLGTAACLVLGSFPFAMIASYALLLRERDWERLEPWRAALERRVRPYAERLLQRAERLRLVAPSRASFRLSRARGTTVLREGLVAVSFAAVLSVTFDLDVADRLDVEPTGRPRFMNAILEAVQLVPDWQLFAPFPSIDDGWWVIDGVTVTGRVVDPLTGERPTFEKPSDLSRRHDVWWRKVLYRLWLRDFADHRLYFGRWITRAYAREHPDDPLDNFRFYYVEERTQPPGTPEPFPRRAVLLWTHDCRVGEADAPEARPPMRPDRSFDQSSAASQTKRSGSPS